MVEIKDIVSKFDLDGDFVSSKSYGSGHINSTFMVEMKHGEELVKYILQKINTKIFTRPAELMENVENVTNFLRKKIIENGGDPERETIRVIKTKDGKNYFKDDEDQYWRMYNFVNDAKSYDVIENNEIFYQSAVAFGNFQKLLNDYPAETLHETIPDFHNTKKRFARFKQVVEEDKLGKAKDVQDEINFYLEREHIANALMDLIEDGKLPIRVTHNDTKSNNVLIDNETGRGICVVDFDTVLPGVSVNDFGDSIRFGTNTGLEDDINLDDVSCDLEKYEAFTKGFLETLDGSLTDTEIDNLPLGALTMTFECGIRFLADHLEGDVYFHTARENHNLDRTRTQMKLIKDMEDNWDKIEEIVNKYR
ncbi:phosphotransferase enzyme family protein [Helcococcus kunzii]|uniref:phosphotransferase enzyme family protein n=1 Tax=Helcococcus kunzii TaxID=40091 RepID=UPI0038A994FA